ncbi:MAG: hypothetical protein AB8G96_03105 [Phycisphaerales bacterium]
MITQLPVIARRAAVLIGLAVASSAAAQVVDPVFADDYDVFDLGSITDLPTPYGGLFIRASEPDVLLIGGGANQASAGIYSVPLVRGCDGSIAGFGGPATFVAAAPQIDGGLIVAPNGTMIYTAYPINQLGQIPAGETKPTRIDDLSGFDVLSSTGSIQWAPPTEGGVDGGVKILSYNGNTWYDGRLAPAEDGLFDLVDVSLRATIQGGPEGVVFVGASSPGFSGPTAIVSEWGAGSVGAWDVDAMGDPVPNTRRPFITGLSGAEGAAIDPVTGEFIFSTFGGGNRVLVVRGFELECAADVAPSGGDGTVDFDDLLTVLSAWGQSCTGPDIDQSGAVDFADVLAVVADWGPC